MRRAFGAAAAAARRTWCPHGPVARASTFVSQHFRLDPALVGDFLARQGWATRDTPTHHIVRACVACPKPHGDKADNLWKLYVRKVDGAYFCHRCGARGSFFDLKTLAGDLPSVGGRGNVDADSAALSPASLRPPSVPIDLEYAHRAAVALTDDPAARPVLQYLTQQRKLDPAVLTEYGVGAVSWRWAPSDGPPVASGGAVAAAEHCIVFPWLLPAPAGSLSPLRPPAAAPAGVPSALPDEWDGGEGGAIGGLPAAPPLAPVTEAAAVARGIAVAGPSLAPPWPSLTLARVKLRSIVDKSHQLLLPRGGGWGLFGLHTVPSTATSLVLTEGELDAMSVRQCTGAHAVSLPNGCRSLPLEVLPLLERFERLYLWMDDDAPGREGAQRMLHKLGRGRCFVVPPTAELVLPTNGALTGRRSLKDANDALRAGVDVSPLLAAAARQPHEEVLSFAQLRAAAMSEVTAAHAPALPGRRSAAGTPFASLPRLTSLVKGHRCGEVTIVTGATGSGKTTLLAQMSLDLALQGVRTMWGSFEIKNTRLLATMLHQLSSAQLAPRAPPAPTAAPAPLSPESTAPSPMGLAAAEAALLDGGVCAKVPLSRSAPPVPIADPAVLESAAARLDALPMHFLRFYGSTDVDRVLDALEYAVYVHDTEHIVLDNLQFMLSAAVSGRGFDRFDVQDRALDRFRAFATKHDVHVTLVIHPRKEAEDAPLNVASVFGSAKATQEADTVLILQRGGDGRKTLDVRKNRYDGTLGSVHLGFDTATRCFQERDPGTVVEGGGGGAGGSAGRLHSHHPSAGRGVAGSGVGAGRRGHGGQARGLHTAAVAFAKKGASGSTGGGGSGRPWLKRDLLYARSKLAGVQGEVEEALLLRWVPTVRERVWPVQVEGMGAGAGGGDVAPAAVDSVGRRPGEPVAGARSN